VYVGRRGNKGEFVVEGGASATLDNLVSAGTMPGASGEIRVVDAGSVLFHSAEGRSMGIGDRGLGSIRIGGPGSQAGAQAVSIGRMDTLSVGLFASAGEPTAGAVEVRGAGSAWTVSANRIFLGYSGGASVLVREGALLDTDSLEEVWIGRYPGRRSVVDIRHAGSRWVERGQPIRIGRDGELAVRTGATVEAQGIIIEPGGRPGGARLAGCGRADR
jgi:T5SS/PEP-CTERM-associated repeat protein